MKNYFFYSKSDRDRERISSTVAVGRLSAARYFARLKNLSLKDFLSVFEVSR